MTNIPITLADWLALDPDQRIAHLYRCCAALDDHDPAWISRLDDIALEAALAQADREGPLFAIPFAIKDNIDAKGWQTTAACPAFAYTPETDAAVVAALRQQGAILVGKTNMDQFASGLVGTRSPYGQVSNPFAPAFISGGSSSGSASVVARGLVPFALGTDTAGSGRVPAGCCNIVGLKPSLGRMSTRGVVPACRSLDCVSIFAHTVSDAQRVLRIAEGFDAADPYSRPLPDATPPPPRRLGIPDHLEWFGDHAAAEAWEHSLGQWAALGVELIPCSFAAMRALASLLYGGPWVAERHAAISDFFAEHAEAMNPVVRTIIASAKDFSASDAYAAEYQRQALKREIHAHFQDVDALLVPTAPRLPTRGEVDADPIVVNSQLGLWTNFVNLADCCALALPAALRRDGLPFGITLIAAAGGDDALAELGADWQQQRQLPLGATGQPWPTIAQPLQPRSQSHTLAVVGAHLSGQALNHQLVTRGARLRRSTHTSPHYQLVALADCTPAKPGLQRVAVGHAIEVEIWDMSAQAFADMVASIPSPLGIGTINLTDGTTVQGFLCEAWAMAAGEDISAYGGWRQWLARAENH